MMWSWLDSDTGAMSEEVLKERRRVLVKSSTRNTRSVRSGKKVLGREGIDKVVKFLRVYQWPKEMKLKRYMRHDLFLQLSRKSILRL